MKILFYKDNKKAEYIFNDYFENKILIISKEIITLKTGYEFINGNKVKNIRDDNLDIKTKDSLINVLISFNISDNYKLYKRKDLLISCKLNSDIILKYNNLNEDYITIKDNNLETNSKYCLINGKHYLNKQLEENDKINFIDLNIIVFDQFYYINSINNTLKEYIPTKHNLVYKTPNKIKTYTKNYIVPTYSFIQPKEYEEEKKKESNILRSIGPSLTMSLPMIYVAIYNIEYNNSSSINLILPVSMLISTILWPFIFYFIENNKYKKKINSQRREYLSYLDEFCKETFRKLTKYNTTLKEYEYINQNLTNDKFNSLTSTNPLFLNVMIGYKKLEYKFEINNIFEKENKHYNNILSNYLLIPNYVSLNNNATIYYNDYQSILNIIYNLLYFSDINEYYICLYKAPSLIKNILYKVSNLYYQDDRLIIDSFNKLKELENSEDIILIFGFDNIEYKFKNNKIKYLYLTNIIEEYYKFSDINIQLFNNHNLLNIKNNNIDTINKVNNTSYNLNILNYIKEYKSINSFSSYKLGSKYYIDNKYKNNDYHLKTAFSYNEELYYLDLHENKDGPHGLICGTTGSGKSELIISLLLGLCMNYPPDYLNIIIIDYKGYGLSDSLQVDNKYLPHIIASLSNNDDSLMDRLIYRLKSECEYREKLFSISKHYLNTSITNIDDYIKLSVGISKLPKLSHILIVIDEFAQLKKEKPEFINSIISLSRIGRSLGIHLILSTQKPSGVIDDQINANINFRICLKVNSEEESRSVINSIEASKIRNKGEFYLRSESKLHHLYSLYSGKDINNGGYKKISILNEDLSINKYKVIHIKESKKEKEVIIENINYICEKNKYIIKDFNLNHPSSVNYKQGNSLYLGLIDNYIDNIRNDYYLDNNILIYSARLNELSTIVYNSEQFIIISNLNINRGNIISCINYYNQEDIKYLFNKLKKEKNKIYLLIDDLYSYLNYDEIYSKLLFEFILLRKENIKVIALTYNDNINYKIVNLFNERLFLSSTLKKESLINLFPTTSIYKDSCQLYKDGIIYPFIPLVIKEFKSNNSNNTYLDKIPDIIKGEIINNKILIGYSVKDRSKYYIYDNDEYLITSYSNELISLFKKYFKFNKVELYNSELLKSNKKILWLGSNINKQRFKNVYFIDDLNDNEAIFLDDKENIIRIINE